MQQRQTIGLQYQKYVFPLSNRLCMSQLSLAPRSPAIAEPGLPPTKSPPLDVFVDSDWVREHCVLQGSGEQNESGSLSPRNGKTNWLIIHVGYGRCSKPPPEGCIPGSIYVNTDEIECDWYLENVPNVDKSQLCASTPTPSTGPTLIHRTTTREQDAAKGIPEGQSLPRNYWSLYPNDLLFKAFAHIGIHVTSQVVVVGSEMLAMSRVVWALLYAGVADVRLLNGGTASWIEHGYTVDHAWKERLPRSNFGTTVPLHPEYLCTADQLREEQKDYCVELGQEQEWSGIELVDVRTRDEHLGSVSPYCYITVCGKIPGSTHMADEHSPWNILYFSSPMMNITSNPFSRRSYKSKVKADPGKSTTKSTNTVFYCGTGWRSSLAFLLARAAGWKNVQNLDGGWLAWCQNEEARVE